MEAFLTELLSGTQGTVAYAAVFGILLLCGFGLPLPEDVSLILGGFLAYQGAVSLYPMMAVCFLGIVIGDSTIFAAGRRVGRNHKPGGLIARFITPEKLAQVEKLFAERGERIVMVARFLPGVRAAVFFTAGASGIRYGRFILFDGLAALLSAPMFVFCGYHFGGEIESFIQTARRAQGAVFVIVACILLASWLLRRNRTRADASKP